jgi:hypothetical protein
MNSSSLPHYCPYCERYYLHPVVTLKQDPDFDVYISWEEALALKLSRGEIIEELCKTCWREVT